MNSPKFTSAVPGEEFWDRNFIELVEKNKYHYITVLCPQPNFLDYDDLLRFTKKLLVSPFELTTRLFFE